LPLALASGLVEEKDTALAERQNLFSFLTASAKALRMNDLIILFGLSLFYLNLSTS
jgi:hypothetical protein